MIRSNLKTIGTASVVALAICLSAAPAFAAYQPHLNLSEGNFSSVFPIVCTKSGCVEGVAKTGYQVDEFEAFYGIPYAEPPIGALRFAVSRTDSFKCQ